MVAYPKRACLFRKWSKNGLNSVLPISPVFGKDKTPKKSRTDAKPEAVS
jgi:hypothetical protein